MISPLASDVLPGPTGTVSTGSVRLPSGPTIDALAPAATSAGTLSAAGEALQRLPTMVQRPCICFEPISLAASTTPGHAFCQRRVLSHDGAGNGGSDAETLGRFPDFAQALDRLDVDDQVRLDEAALHSYQEVAASGEDCGSAGRSRNQSDGIFHGQWTYVAHRLPWVVAIQLL